MKIDKNLIKHWAYLFESEEARENGTATVLESVDWDGAQVWIGRIGEMFRDASIDELLHDTGKWEKKIVGGVSGTPEAETVEFRVEKRESDGTKTEISYYPEVDSASMYVSVGEGSSKEWAAIHFDDVFERKIRVYDREGFEGNPISEMDVARIVAVVKAVCDGNVGREEVDSFERRDFGSGGLAKVVFELSGGKFNGVTMEAALSEKDID